ncbi:MAG: porin [Hydrogenophaga sp.]|uniref:Porin n=1 Tax=Hydrogenophaga crocea TaxID=2716225 RepID=A0A6G8IMI1_9BURK|nr:MULTISPECIES: porin [Hydrogenophaga]MBL0943205.1 porin [Hydrogenophaga sp.]QIM54394.1 porin [Hydrogenophaga crocea]
MKKTLIALAAVAASSAALAQSSVTLFGIVDVAVRNVKQGGVSQSSLSQDGTASSRIGFRGVEDLGGGMSASFWLEGALDPDTGNAAGLTFQRRSTVSLSGGFGEVRLGRDYTPTFWNHTVYDPFGTNGVGSSTNTFGALGSGATTVVRANNTIAYFTPNISGFQGQFQYAFKETQTDNDPNKYAGLRLTYNAGPLSVALATAAEGSAAANVNKFKRTNVGASYDFGFIKPMAQYTIGKFETNAGVDQEVKHLMVGLTAPVGPGLIKASYTRSSYDNFAGDANQVAIGYEYGLSKRTALYTNYSRISNKVGAAFSVSAEAGATGAAVTPGQSSRGFEVGVRHSF